MSIGYTPTKQYFKELWHFRELYWAFTVREIKVRYKQTILGAGWAILQPLALTVIFTVVFGFLLRFGSGDIPYPVFAYSALLPWTFFSNAVSFGSLSVVNNSSLVTKIYFPRELLPLATITAALFDLIIASVIFLLMLFIYKIPITQNIVWLVVIIPSIFLLTTGISLFLSTLNVLFRDIKFIIPLLLQVWFYLTPIIYSLNSISDKYQRFYILNPMAPLIDSFRDVTVLGAQPDTTPLLFAAFFSLLVFLGGIIFFRRKERTFADVI